MIKVQDWIASIPDEEKHIAYVGEGKSVQKEFLLCGEGWETYQHWTFFLDMAFDLESITTRDSRQVVSTQINRSEIDEATGVTADEVILKETYTTHDEKVLEYDRTDIAPLTKRVEKDGIHLTWTVLRQHTVLPGKLWATLRAVSGEIDQIKKSDILVFEVDAAICAVPATVPAISDMEQIRQQVAEAKDEAVFANSGANAAADRAYESAGKAWNAMYECENYAELVTTKWEETSAYAQTAQQAQEQATAEARAAAENKQAAYDLALSARQSSEEAEESARIAAEMRGEASNQANSAAEMYRLAMLEAEAATQAKNTAVEAVGMCESYSHRCEDLVSSVETEMYKLDNLTYHRINVRDYGAVGDGVTDDRGAIMCAFDEAKRKLPCEVYFPAGVYGISNGITVEMPLGSGGLRVCGAGRDVSIIRYLESYDPNQDGNMWYAIRIWPDGMQKKPQIPPSTETEWLHDISYAGLTVQDPDPCAHAWHTSKGDPTNEETHGVDIVYCKGVSVTDCQFVTVGDEAIDLYFCHDVVVMNNRLIGSPGAGPGGGAISVGDGCQGVVVCGNTIHGSAPDETLADGTVIAKSNYAIAVESLYAPVKDVTITANVIRNIHGKGINLGANNPGAGIDNVVMSDNVIHNCDTGIRMSGTLLKDNVKITNNLIVDCTENAIWTSKVGNLTICGNTFRNVGGEYAVNTLTYGGNSHQWIADNVFENVAYGALCCAGNVVLKDCSFYGVGMAEEASSSAVYGIYRYNGTLTVSGCIFQNVRMAVLRSCLHGAEEIDNTTIEVVNKTTGEVDGGGASVTGSVRRIVGSSLVGRVELMQDNAIMQGTKITYKGSAHAVVVVANGVSITGCVILADNGSYRSIYETGGYNHNLFANNIVNRSIALSGTQSIAVNNVDTRETA